MPRADRARPPWRGRRLSIRTLLLLLVFGVWLPAVGGFGLLARSTYVRETEDAREDVQRLAENLNLLVERELDNRIVIARTLGASPALAAGDFPTFHAEATAATRGTDSWAAVMDRTTLRFNTLVPLDDFKPLPRGENAPFAVGDPLLSYTPRGHATPRPLLAALAPDLGGSAPRYNVGVVFEPAVIQAIVDAGRYSDATLAAVINADQFIIARSRDPAKWLGKVASPIIRERVKGAGSFLESVTLDGVPSVTFVSKPNRYAWNVVIALPQAALARSAQRLTAQAIGASGALLLIGLAIALVTARRIASTAVELRRSAAMLGEDRIPLRLATGVAEIDDVGAVLHDAARRSHEATRTLETRVAQAVDAAREAQSKLLQSQKLEAMGRLTGGVAHDFNNLLAIVNASLHVQNLKHPEHAQENHLQAMGRAVRSGVRLTRQLLSFARRQALNPEAIDLARWLPSTAELIRSTLGRTIPAEFEVDADVPNIVVDAAELELALINLAMNARHAMPDGGTLRIVARRAEPAPGDAGEMVEIQVIDSGVGIAPDVLPHVVEPFFTTRERGVGSGLGLAQVNGFCEQAGGSLRIESELGRGTRVCLRLPAGAAQSRRGPGGDAAAQAPRAELSGRVLLVEDNADVADSMHALLLASGLDVTLARSAQEALERLADGSARPDVVLSDIAMPGELSGIDLAFRLRELHPTLPVILTTGFADQLALALQGGLEVLQKPVHPRRLLERLREALPGARDNDA